MMLKYYCSRCVRNILNFFHFIFSCKKKFVFDKNYYDVIFTHDLGGGTEVYLKTNFNLEENIVIRNLSSSFFDFGYYVNYKGKKYFYYPGQLEKLLKSINIKSLYINSLVSFANIFKLQKLIFELGHTSSVKILFHDYYPLCPNYMMSCFTDSCLNKCAKLIKVPLLLKFVSFEKWQYHWEIIFSIADEIVVFSNSTKNIVLNFYPMYKDKIKVIPHDLSYLNQIKPFTSKELQLDTIKVGVIGNINSKEKGIDIIKSLLKKISITVIGNIQLKSNRLTITGAYKIENLKNIIFQSGINVILFPSLWNETFSYIVSEIIALGLPVVCFDYGAQAEKIKLYKYGIVCKSLDIDDIIYSLQEAFNKWKLD